MPFIGILEIILSLFCFILWILWINRRDRLIGMLPGLLSGNIRLHDFIADAMKKYGRTVKFRGPLFSKLEILITCHPANLNHILCRNFSNYGKGSDFKEIFESFGDGIFGADSDSWKAQRRILQAMIKHGKFELYSEKIVRHKVETTLITVIEHFMENRTVVDLQDLFQRFTFDNVCLMVLGFDPKCLSIELAEILYEKAFDVMEEAVIYRHMVPTRVWKILKWLQIGEEKRLKLASDRFDTFLYDCIAKKKEKIKNRGTFLLGDDEFDMDLFTTFMVEGEDGEVSMEEFMKTEKFLRDIAFNLMTAGRGTVSSGLTWFFWLVATHPLVESKILDEIKSNLSDGKKRFMEFTTKELTSNFVYLHAALCETLRMYPPIPINEKSANEEDILPTGHRVKCGTRILIPFYTMARMPKIWGGDCLEFKPERWISDRGGITYVPSYKFTAFNAGPRTCLGKDMSFIQLKIVAISVLWNYHIDVVEGHNVIPSNSMVLSMRDGLKVRITRRPSSIK
ncbi:hypothetical protein ACFE04_009550 [Oxalis oulophora]